MDNVKETPPENVSVPQQKGTHVSVTYTVLAPREKLFMIWLEFERLPLFMHHLEEVTVYDATRSHWKAKAPLGTTVEWDAEIINMIPNELIAWRSVEGSQISNAGSVHFKDAPAGRGTEVRVTLEYVPPAGKAGEWFAKLFGKEPSQAIEKDLRRFKTWVESDEMA